MHISSATIGGDRQSRSTICVDFVLSTRPPEGAQVVIEPGMSFARFLGELAGALAPTHPGLRRTLWGALQRAQSTPSPTEAMAVWLRRHATEKPLEITLAGLDAADPAIVAFVIAAVERSAGAHWTLAGADFDAFPVGDWLKRGLARAPERRETDAHEAPQPTRPRSPMPVLLETRDPGEILDLLGTHGFALIESDDAYAMHDALAALPEDRKAESAVVQTLLAMAASLDGRPDVAEAHFRTAAGLARDAIERARVSYQFATDLMRRGVSDAAAEMLEENLEVAGIPESLRIASMSALAAAHAMGGRSAKAARMATDALQAASRSEDEALYARALHQAAFVAMRETRYDDALRLATEARTRAEEIGLFETAGGAASVEYCLHWGIFEDLQASLAALYRVADCGARSGNLNKQMYGLSGAYEIEVERGDEDAIAAIEIELDEFEIAYGTLPTDETIATSQAMQVGWKREFARAHQMLRSTGDRQLDAARRTMRWAEVALYAGAAHNARATEEAIEHARRHLETAEPGDPHTVRARTFLALALALCVRTAEAAEEAEGLHAFVADKQPRLRALADFAVALQRWASGKVTSEALLESLERLRACDLAGFARLFETLPAETLERHAAPATGRIYTHVPEAERTLAIRLLAPAFERAAELAPADCRATLLDIAETAMRPGREAAFAALFNAAAAAGVQALPNSGEIVEAVGRTGARLRYERYFNEVDGAIEALLAKMPPEELMHARSVASWSGRIAGRLGLSQRETRFATQAGLLHGIGVLRLPGRASEEMLARALTGERMVRRVPALAEFAPVVRAYCEPAGAQPRRSANDALPLAARIVAVAERFHDELSGYRSGAPRRAGDALAAVVAEAGTRYDAGVVAALSGLF